ncbi:Lead, cadmium, zinc and mercury transporting ATPase [Minicystis rosea]|nr:Lead, cadmium, zinc and mercury transporting ATPase [Minicystis rosea]
MSTQKSLLRTSILTIALAALAASCSKPSDAGSGAAGKDAPQTDGRRIDVAVTAEGYTPSTIEAKKGESLVLRFTRTTKGECLAQVVFPDQKITKDLPLNTPVEVAIKADKAGKIPFQCGMNMVRGSINVTGS